MPSQDEHDHNHDDHDHEHEHDEDVDDEEDEDDIVVLTGADGTDLEFHFLAVVELDGDNYALLTPANESEDEEAATEVFIFLYEVAEDGSENFSDVTDESLFQRVQAEAEKLFAESDDDVS